ncbi:hypothetical protein [Terrabacter sp. BE26]|uniref:hypothetical protein n=1 Tax=Terrabacter sp. BE26 TaxID=2898152 RepID=UPI0035BE6063
MGWLSRTFRPAGPSSEAAQPGSPAGSPPVPVAPGAGAEAPEAIPPAASEAVQAMPAKGPSSPTGRYGPLVSVSRFDVAPPELEWQLPLNGELYRLMPGSDRPDYSLFVLERPLHFYPPEGFDLARVEPGRLVQDRKGRTMVRVHAMLLCARFVGQQLHPGMKDLAVNLAYVVDNSLARDAEVDFGKIHFAAIGFLSEGHAARTAGESVAASADEPVEASADASVEDGRSMGEAAERPTSSHLSDVLDELARTLRRGIEAQRGTRVDRLTAALTIDPEHQLTGLSGNADGQPPVPSPETFDRLAEVLARLAPLGEAGRVAAVTVRVEGDAVSHEVTATHG